MGFLDRIIQKFNPKLADPTVDWGEFNSVELVVAPAEMCIGKLKFGDSLSVAESLGRPSSFRWARPDYCELVYAEGGFQIDFEGDRLAFVAIFLDQHECEPEGVRLTYSSPVLQQATGERVELSRQMKAADLIKVFGHPKTIDKDEDETILFYEGASLSMEFELRPQTHTLARWNLYPESDE